MTSPPKDPTEASDAPNDDVPGSPGAEAAAPKKKVDPWHFGAHTVPPQLRAELSAMTLPESREERRYRRPNAESTSDSPAPPVDTSRADPTVMIPRVAIRRDKRLVVGAVIGVALLLLFAAVLSRGTSNPANPAAESPSGNPAATAGVRSKSTDAAANPNPATTSAAITQPAMSPSVAVPVTAPDPGASDKSNPASHKARTSTRPAPPAQAKPVAPVPTASVTSRPSSGHLIPADD